MLRRPKLKQNAIAGILLATLLLAGIAFAPLYAGETKNCSLKVKYIKEHELPKVRLFGLCI